MGGYVLVILLVIMCYLGKGAATNPTLSVDLNEVFVNSSVTLTCSTTSQPGFVGWYYKKDSRNPDNVLNHRWIDEKQMCGEQKTTDNNMECSCNSPLMYMCTIKSVTMINDGQEWYCRAENNVYVISNSYTFKILLPLQITSVSIQPETSIAYPVFNVTSTFTCITSLSRPGATIQWFSDGANITHWGSYSYKDDVARSTLEYTSRSNKYSTGNLTCVASYAFRTMKTVLSASKTLRVQFPVSKPTVIVNNLSTSSTFTIREGRFVHLNCSSSSGYPPPFYDWTYKGGKSPGALVNITFTRNNGTVSCRAFNFMYTLDGKNSNQSTEQILVLNISVLYSPTIPKLSDRDNNSEIVYNTIRVLRGDNISIMCASEANPPATVLWQGQKTNSHLLSVINLQRDTVWTCQASNTINEDDGTSSTETATRNVSAIVLYGPDTPTITYTILTKSEASLKVSNESIRVIEGSNITMICSANSMPISIYSWDLLNEGHIRTIANVTRTTKTRYACTARNIMESSFKGSITGSNSASVNMDVLYGPEKVTAKYNNVTLISQVLKVIRGWSFSISCFASSNPASSIFWYDTEPQAGYDLIIINVRTGRNVTCSATNNMVDSAGYSQSGKATETFTIDVLYEPVVQRLQNQTALLNTSLTVVCNLTDAGNPPASTFKWLRKDNKTVIGTEQTLSFKTIRLTDEGEYQCNVSNRMQSIGNIEVNGLSYSTFYVDVEYGAYIRLFKANESPNSIAVHQGETVDLVCDANGDPEPVVRIIHSTRKNERILNETEGPEAKYRIEYAQCEYDTGNYTCLANNRYNEGTQLLALFVYCSPRASPFSPPITTSYGAPNDAVLFTFTISAYPKPTSQDVVWYKRDDETWRVLSDDTNFLVTLSDDSMQTHLTIFHVQNADYTDYMVNVSNELGSTVEVFTLKAQSKPDVPKEVHVSRTGKTELFVEWMPGFNGGENETFTIRYKVLGAISWIVIPINISNNIWTLDGLTTGTTYQIQIRAQNKIGESEWTQEMNTTTLVEAVDKGSTSSTIGGSIGGAAGVVVIVVVAVFLWRYRTRGIPKPGLKPILTRGSINHANGAYENIDMVTPGMKTKRNKEEMESSRPDNDNSRLCKDGHTLSPCSSKGNSSDKHAVKSVPINDGNQSGQNNAQFTAGNQSLQNHYTVLSDISDSPLAAPSIYTPLQRRDSFSIEHDPIYDNLYKNKKLFKNRQISIQNLRETSIRDKKNKTDVFTEYSALSVASEKIKGTTNAAIKTANTAKNRYRNMYPYDNNRVVLSVIGNDKDTDFINASFIHGYSCPKKYIAAQGPLECTIADFWRMIWETNARVVVMVTNLVEDSKRKCSEYWPKEATNDCQYGDSTIHLLAEEYYADFVIRTLQCKRNGCSKTITHLHFTAWPDKDVPDTALSLLQFWREVRRVEKPEESPWIVHCSAGVGRTGTFIALDYLYDQGVSEKQITLFDAVLLLREQRINMVQTKNQYLYLQEVLCEALCPVGEVLSNKTFLENKLTSDNLNQQYMTICKSQIAEKEEQTVDDDDIKVLDGEKPENNAKNVDKCVIPDDRYRPVLNMAVNTRGHTDYINAVYLSTFHEGDRLILTQSANKSSDVDFVRLLHDHYVRTIVVLGDQMEPYLPENGATIVIGPYTASSISCEQKQDFQECFVRFKHIGERDGFDVLVFRFTNWSKQFDLCQANELLGMLNDVQERAATDGPVVIQCHDGYSRSGLVAVLWSLMERSKRDGEVAVAETVRLIRRRRPQVISNEAQYSFCHEFMKGFVEGCVVCTNS